MNQPQEALDSPFGMPQLEALAADLMAIPAAPEHEVSLHREAAQAFLAMQRAAEADAVSLWAVSGFRSVARQTAIWNRKFTAAIAKGFSPAEALTEVLTYSAPPLWSRHHWGTDLDLIQVHPKGVIELEEADWIEGGSSFEAECWLAQNAASFGFYKPYDKKRRGFAAEPWHWSFEPLSRPDFAKLAELNWLPWLRSQAFLGADLIADDFDSLFKRYVLDINPRLT